MVEGRLGAGLASYGTGTPPELREKENTSLRGEPLAAFRKFDTATATFGSAAGVACALEFFGPERLLFASDMPFGLEQGAAHIRTALTAVNGLPVDDAQREAILHTNCARIQGGQRR